MISDLIKRYPALEISADDIKESAKAIIECYKKGGKVLLCGNGGSAADCEHISAELMKGFLKHRALSESEKASMKQNNPQISEEFLCALQKGVPAIALSSLTGLNTAFSNDITAEYAYAQGVMSLGKRGDILIAISTSGNSANVFAAAQVAKALGLCVIALTGVDGGKIAKLADIAIRVPENETYKIQELHLPVYHCICAMVEAELF